MRNGRRFLPMLSSGASALALGDELAAVLHLKFTRTRRRSCFNFVERCNGLPTVQLGAPPNSPVLSQHAEEASIQSHMQAALATVPGHCQCPSRHRRAIQPNGIL